MAFKMKGHSLPGPHQRKSPAKDFEGEVHNHPHTSGEKKTSEAMKKKMREVKAANLKETNEILVSQGKDPLSKESYKSITSPATSKSPTKQGVIWGPKGNERMMDAFGKETKIEKDRRQKTYRKPGESKYQTDVRRNREQSKYEKGLGKRNEAMWQRMADLERKSTKGEKAPDLKNQSWEKAPLSPRKKKSPAKIAPLVMMGAQMLGKKMMEKKDDDSPATQTKKPNIKLMGKTGAAKPKTKMLKGTTVFGKTISERNKAFPFGQGPKIRKYAKKLRTGIQKFKKK